MNQKKILTVLLMLLTHVGNSQTAEDTGGNGAGNGGFARVCRAGDRLGKVLEAEFADLWWGREELNLKNLRSKEPALTQAKEKVQFLLDVDDDYFSTLPTEMEKVISEHRVLSENTGLKDPGDNYRNITLINRDPAKSCAVETLINYTKDDNILIKKDVWEFLTSAAAKGTELETDVAAAYLHEAVYKLVRSKEKTPTSEKASLFVAMAFSGMTVADYTKWYKNYLTTKRYKTTEAIPAVDINEGIDSDIIQSSGDRDKDIVSAKANWSKKCEAWKKKVRQSLDPISRFAYPTCRENKIIIQDVAGGVQVSSLARISAGPKLEIVREMRDTVPGDFFPLTSDINSDKLKSIESYNQACDAWKKKMLTRFGSLTFYVSCGFRQDSSTQYAVGQEWVDTTGVIYFGNYAARRYPPTGYWKSIMKNVGYTSYSIGSVFLYSKKYIWADSYSQPEVCSDYVTVQSGTEGDAFAVANKGYLKACEDTRNTSPNGTFRSCGVSGDTFKFQTRDSQIRLCSKSALYRLN